jgi:hypothetical protein
VNRGKEEGEERVEKGGGSYLYMGMEKKGR